MKEENQNRFKITSDYDCISNEEVFKDLLKVLMTFAYKLIGNCSLRLEKNRDELAYDFSMECIKRYLEKPSEFDPSRNSDLVNYLKFNILRRLISNFKELKSQKIEFLYENDDLIGIEVLSSYLPELDLHESIDLREVVKSIKKEIEDSPELIQIFKLRYLKDYSRSETIEALQISENEYNNRIRRLDTVRKNVVRKTQIIL